MCLLLLGNEDKNPLQFTRLNETFSSRSKYVNDRHLRKYNKFIENIMRILSFDRSSSFTQKQQLNSWADREFPVRRGSFCAPAYDFVKF